MFSYKKLSILFSTALLITIIGQAQANTPDAASKAVSEAVVNENNDFPGREKNAHVPYISIDELYNEYDDIVIVDARSPYEFETLRILSAVNIPLSLNNSDYTGNYRICAKRIQVKRSCFTVMATPA